MPSTEGVFISFVTVNRNNRLGLQATFSAYRELIFRERSWDLEIIVVDACSVDGSADVLDANSDIIDVLIIERDYGIYDGMNKGLMQVSGDFVVFVNSGDRILCDGFLELVSLISDRDFAYAGEAIQEKTGKKTRVIPLLLWLPCHQAIVFPANELKERTFLWGQYPVSADLDHKSVFWFSKRMKYFELPIALCEPAGFSAQYNSVGDVFSRACARLFIGFRNGAPLAGVISFFAVFFKHLIFR